MHRGSWADGPAATLSPRRETERARSVLGTTFFLLILVALLGIFVFDTVKNADWFRHLTNWVLVVNCVLTFLLLFEEWNTSERVMRDGILHVGVTINGGVVGGMLVLYAQDRSVLDEAAQQYGRALMETGNFVLHFAPLLLFWGFHAIHRHRPSLHTKLYAENNSSFLLFSFMHFNFCAVLILTYGALFQAREEYGSKIDPVSMGVAIFSTAFLNHLLFIESIAVKSKA